MKKHLLYVLAITAINLSACGPVYIVHQDPQPAPPDATAQANPDDVTYQNFYDQLSPYGQWIQDPNYGYVWLPDVGQDFKPYSTNGHWVYTDEGWAWDSGYPWGWAAFHYGRWFFQDGYGWMWVPGTEWAPAWVSWRNSDEYYGWAPMAPNVSYDAAYGGGYMPPVYYWNFVPHRYISSPQVNNYYVRETNNITIVNQTTIIRNTTIVNNSPGGRHYGYGPDAGEVGRFSGNPVRPLVIRDSHTPGARTDNGNFTVYRPRVNGGAADNRSNSAGRPFAPSRVQPLNNARPVNRTVYGNNNGGNPGNYNGRDDRNNGRDYNGRDNNGGRTNTGFPNNPNNQPNQQPANNQPARNNPPVNQPATQPVTPPVQNNTPSRPYNQPVPPGNQPNTRFGRPFQPNNQPNQQPAQNQPAQNSPAPNPPAPNPPANQPRNNPPAQQNQPPANQQFIPPTRPAIARPQQPFNRPSQPPPANQNQPRPVVNPPKPATPPPPPPKKDDDKRPGRPS